MHEAFPIVAIGASAGGLEAFEAFFKEMPDKADIAFILVAHLDPTHVSLLPELVQKHSRMKVQQVQDGVRVEPNQIYVIPPNKTLLIKDNALFLSEFEKARGFNLPIDTFFVSLAEDQADKAICIILSGTGSDGTMGLKAIKAENGMVMVQQVESAKYDGMPKNAIATGLADFILPVDKMPEQLIKYVSHAFGRNGSAVVSIDQRLPTALQKIYSILHARTNQDFSLYKKNTICRRIERRMNVHQIADIQEYVRYLTDSEREVEILFKELLIGVTNFFRDPNAFDALKNDHLPKLLENKPGDYTVRIWVSGCSTGEEAYSLAILLKEYMVEHKIHFNVQIFGTDIDEDAISTARTGVYPDSIQRDVSPERLKKFFSKENDDQYRIKSSIREMLVFAPQNIIKDPPFTKLDLLSCRNLLIYLGPELQKKLIPVFHYSLKPEGILFLGSSESIGQANDLFSALNKKWKIFKKQYSEDSKKSALVLPEPPRSIDDVEPEMPDSIRKAEELSVLQLVETILKQSNTPPCAIIDDSNNVIYIHGRTGHFLEPAEGRISVNILEMARPGLRPTLSSAIKKVAMHKQEVVTRDLRLERDNEISFLDITIKPILEQSLMRGLMMVIFEEKTQPSLKVQTEIKSAIDKEPTRSAEEVERELTHTKESLQTTIEELETSNEELKSTNEELQSTNEELQSTNEEMETSKEELQSLNEESATVNAELQSRIDELSKTNDDMKNLLDSTNIATVFLDTDLCIRRYTPKATDIIPITASDVGRPIHHLVTSLINADISSTGNQVLKDLIPQEIEVHTDDANSYVMKVRPYRTMNNIIDGLVVTFEDITTRKIAEFETQESEAKYRMLFELASDSIALFDALSGDICECNENSYTRLGYTRDEFLSLGLTDIENPDSTSSISSHVNTILENGSDTLLTEHRCKNGDVKKALVKATAVIFKDKKYILSTWTDGN